MKKSDKASKDNQAEVAPVDQPRAQRPDGEPTPASGRVRPEESVLDELSRAFGTDAVDDNADLIADGTADGTADEAADLWIVPSDGSGTSASESRTPTPPAERATIRIGEDFGTAAIDTVPLRESIGSAPLDADVVITERRATDSTRSTIAIGGGEDLPDAVYLDGGLGVRDDSGTVFIDDDGTGDALAIKDATAPGIEPRLRQRRIGVRRAASRQRIKWVVLGALGVAVVLGILTVLGSGWFAVDGVDVSGAVYTDENRLQLVIDELDGTPVLLVDTDAAEKELEAIPWVEDARVRAHFPNSATIEIRERKPQATMAGVDGRFRVLDADGRVLDVIEGQPVAFILLSGPSTLDLAAGQFAPVGPSWAAALVPKLTPTIRPRVLSIEVTDDGSDLVIYLTPGDNEQTAPIRVRFGSAIGDSDQIEKLVWLEDRLDDPDANTVTEINVTTNEVTNL